MRVVVVGAGVGGLTAAALLLKAGCQVTVLEAHVYPGGCAGTFFHKGFRFDAGATLAGGFSGGGPHARLAQQLGLTWPVHPVDPAWVVHLPDGEVSQPASRQMWRGVWQHAFPSSASFWETQELLANISWDISAREFPWPPQTPREAWAVLTALRAPVARALPFLTRRVVDLPGLKHNARLKMFVDAQLLIAAQTTSDHCSALYGAAALDLPRRGVNHVRGGMGGIALTLWDWLRQHGATLHTRHPVTQVDPRGDGTVRVCTSRGLEVEADVALANVTPWALRDLLGDAAPDGLRATVAHTPETWGAFTAYLGVDANAVGPLKADHHQVVVDPALPLGEGNSVFVSLADQADPDRAPPGLRAVTLSTHTALAPWWELARRNPEGLARRKELYTQRLISAAQRAIPGLAASARLVMPGSPLAFQRFTRRPRGMVGGFAQTSLFDVRGPDVGLPNVFMVGDSIFPGQSTAGVTLGGMRVAERVLALAPRRRAAVHRAAAPQGT